jgi:hypothetical protein
MHCLAIKGSIAKPSEVIELLKGVKDIVNLSTDKGSEFINKEVKDYLENRDIKHRTWQEGKKDSFDHNHLGKVERSNGTIKNIIFKLLESKKTKKWIDKLQDAVDMYNSQQHSSIKMAPIDVSPRDEEMIILKAQQKTRKILQNDNFEIGDEVRIPVAKTLFSKWGIRYSKDIYTIIERTGKEHKKNAITYRVENDKGVNVPKLFKYYDLVLHKKKNDDKKDKNNDNKSTLDKAAIDNKKASKAKRLLNPIKDHLTAPKTKTANTRNRRNHRKKPDKKTIHNDDIFLVSELRRLGHGTKFQANATLADIKKQFNWTRAQLVSLIN